MQVFTLFDVKQEGKVYFADFVKALHVFHPDTSVEEKIDCNIDVNNCIMLILLTVNLLKL